MIPDEMVECQRMAYIHVGLGLPSSLCSAPELAPAI